ncbi:hypothetical protein JJB97_00990 [Enterobacterales bacterium BIT-L3]|uniref:Uncharacterized protein n=2 Tax=Tenebrionibacter/Tenebrionicola group TaxID=2969848 RepID=A0A8K0XVI8_9ENTR|nr:hypothetical protein [Tenebrionibacter intestinalis]MBV5096392.1 hypothetical protein [Tenebrionicola larvae]
MFHRALSKRNSRLTLSGQHYDHTGGFLSPMALNLPSRRR